MASGPCLRRGRVVRRYMPTHINDERLYVKLSSSIHVSMYSEPFREGSAVNTGVPHPTGPIHRKLGLDHARTVRRSGAPGGVGGTQTPRPSAHASTSTSDRCGHVTTVNWGGTPLCP